MFAAYLPASDLLAKDLLLKYACSKELKRVSDTTQR
jgi:hypothetical protein